MEVKSGYKQSELGVIPEDWDVRTFGELFDVTAGGDFDPKRSSSDQDEKYCYPIYSNALTNQGLYGYCSYADHQAGSITITARGTLGRANYRDHSFTAIGRVLVLHPKNEIDGNFFAEVINNRVKFAIESTGVPQLTAPQIFNYRLTVPTLPEQCSIATALSDVDALINSLDRLIAKKRDLKQAAMQELLTGKRRLPGFSGEWEMKKLGDVVQLKNGYAFKSSTYSEAGTFKIITIASVQDGFLTTSECARIEQLPADIQSHHKLDLGDYLISMTGNVGRVCKVVETNCLLNQRVGKLVPYLVESDLLFQLVRQKSFLQAMMLKAKGGAQGNLSVTDILEYEVHIPLDRREQIAIAAVLSDMDAEIVALEQKRDKTIALKQGMMQELLTGRIRLV